MQFKYTLSNMFSTWKQTSGQTSNHFLFRWQQVLRMLVMPTCQSVDNGVKQSIRKPLLQGTSYCFKLDFWSILPIRGQFQWLASGRGVFTPQFFHRHSFFRSCDGLRHHSIGQIALQCAGVDDALLDAVAQFHPFISHHYDAVVASMQLKYHFNNLY